MAKMIYQTPIIMLLIDKYKSQSLSFVYLSHV